MKLKLFSLLLFTILIISTEFTFSQSNPVVLQPGISIDRIMTVQNGVIRLGKDPVTKNIFYVQTGGNIYQVIQPSTGPAYDSLVFSKTDHSVSYVQGMVFFDSTLYVSGNNHSDSLLTIGIIARGKLMPDNSRHWDTLMLTQYYKTADYFDHLFSGITLNPSGDSIFICSGARGDHGEVQTRYGAYPGLRNVPLTTNIFSLPTHNAGAIVLQNDSAWLAASGFLFCRGVRNHFDLAFDSDGHLFGVENSGDRDHNEEMNWLQKNHHYGFPWKMGDTDNPAQYPAFNPATDKLINHYSRSWRNGFWNNDPTFPPPPSGITFDNPIQNFGPDCDKFRDTLGGVHDASDSGISIGTFTGHRSPLGLVFDNAKVLAPLYNGDAFMLSWTKGYDTCGCTVVPDTGVGPYVDPSQDLVHLDLHFDSIAWSFSLNATRIIGEFSHPVDADIDSNIIYVIENGYGGTSGLYKVTLPILDYPCNPVLDVNILNPCFTDSNIVSLPSFGTLPDYISWHASDGSIIREDTIFTSGDTIRFLPSGNYSVVFHDLLSCGIDSVNFSIPVDFELTIDSIDNTTCIGCSDGRFSFTTIGGIPPFSYSIPAGAIVSGNSIINLSSGSYQICITDSNGCMACDSVVILEDPTKVYDLSSLNKIVVFPNPANDFAMINFIGASKDEVSIRLLDLNGSEMKIIANEFRSVDRTGYYLRLENVSSGYYSIEFKSGENRIYKKLIIMH